MRVVLAIALVLVTSTAAHAATWYLMAADVKAMSNPSVANRMSKGSRLGPLELASEGEFPSREQCEPARDKLVDAWRRQSVNKRGGWNKYGIRSPAEFIRCVPATDPHLTRVRVAGKSTPALSLEVLLNKRRAP